ncbi:hypothetical protein GGQ60_001238 [Pedobacter zeae]|uniref:Uncharacterized protein n=1 Tax=Pedobacter zeae TaxID=1737356 RepID=A0A7W6K8R4_9SPHI|nr:hypothetical protein [Pedobacter zeae]
MSNRELDHINEGISAKVYMRFAFAYSKNFLLTRSGSVEI